MSLRISQVTFAGILIALQVVIAVVIVLEVYHFRRRRTVVSTAQFIVRLIGGALFIVLLNMIFAGAFAFKFTSPLGEAWFWVCCIVLALLLLIIGFVDVHFVLRHKRKREEKLYEDLARDIITPLLRKATEEHAEDNIEKSHNGNGK